MNGQMQAFCATCLAALLHLAMFATWPVLQGAESSGAGGEARLSIHAANAELAALVAAWETPPEVSVTPSMMPPPDRAGHRTPQVRQQTDATVMPPPLASVLALPELTSPPPDTVPLADSSSSPAPPARAVDAIAEPVDAPQTPPATRPKARPDRPAPSAKQAAARASDVAPPAPAQAAEQAAGSGQAEQAGQARADHTAARTTTRQTDLIAQWGASIRNRVERRKTYPAAAGRAQGRVLLTLTVHQNGQLLDVSLRASSGNTALDGAAIRAVKAAGRFPVAPSGLTAQQYSFSLPVSFAR